MTFSVYNGSNQGHLWTIYNLTVFKQNNWHHHQYHRQYWQCHGLVSDYLRLIFNSFLLQVILNLTCIYYVRAKRSVKQRSFHLCCGAQNLIKWSYSTFHPNHLGGWSDLTLTTYATAPPLPAPSFMAQIIRDKKRGRMAQNGDVTESFGSTWLVLSTEWSCPSLSDQDRQVQQVQLHHNGAPMTSSLRDAILDWNELSIGKWNFIVRNFWSGLHSGDKNPENHGERWCQSVNYRLYTVKSYIKKKAEYEHKCSTCKIMM